MTASTLDSSMIRLEGIKENKHRYNKNKIAEAEALAAEALRMANEAKLAAARLAEVKKTLSMFSKKLESVEQTVQKEVKTKSIVAGHSFQKDSFVEKNLIVVAEAPVKKDLITEEPKEEELAIVETPSKESAEEKPSEQELVELVKKEHSPVGVEEVDVEPIEEKNILIVDEEHVEKAIEKELVTVDEVVEDPDKVNAPVAVAEDESKPDFIENTAAVEKHEAGIVSQNLVGNDVVKIVETSRGALHQLTTQEPKLVEDDVSSEHGSEKSPSDVFEATNEQGSQKNSSEFKQAAPNEQGNRKNSSDVVEPTKIDQQGPIKQLIPDPPANARMKENKQPTTHSSLRTQEIKSTEKSDAFRAVSTPVMIPEKGDAFRAVAAPMVIPPLEDNLEYQTYVGAEDYEKDIIEDFLDSLGVDKMCGVDDRTLGFTDRPVPPPPPPPEPLPPFENPTRVEIKNPLGPQDTLHSTSWKEKIAIAQREQRNLQPKKFQTSPVNDDFTDPFGVDHDDLVFCGKLADLCEPPDFEDDYVVSQ